MMYYVGLGTPEEMIENLTRSYTARGVEEISARRLAEKDVADIRADQDSDMHIVQVSPLRFTRRRGMSRTLASQGNILWKEENGARLYFPVGSYMLVRGSYIFHVAASLDEISEAIMAHNDRITAMAA